MIRDFVVSIPDSNAGCQDALSGTSEEHCEVKWREANLLQSAV